MFAIPTTKGGRKTSDLILREDQKEHQKALALQKRFEKKALNNDMDMEALLLFGQPGARLTATGSPVIGFGKKNVNEVRGRRRK